MAKRKHHKHTSKKRLHSKRAEAETIQAQASSRNTLKMVLAGLAAISIVAVAGLIYVTQQTEQEQAMVTKKIVSSTIYKQGGVYQCRRIPAFVAENGLRQPVAVDTKQSRFLGPVFRELKENGKLFRDKSWEQAGHVGPVILDQRGDVFIIPVPAVSLNHNPPAKQNRIYKIDGRSAKMELFLELPGDALPNNDNPFGAMGQAYDCETDSLYVSSIAGSKPLEEHGKIFQIDAKSGQLLSTLEGIDTIGLGVFNLLKEKRLYFGSARNSGVYSVALDKAGHFIGKPQYEFALSEMSDGSTTKAKKFRFSKAKDGSHLMMVSELDFDYRLTAQNTKLVKRYIYQLDSKNKQWRYLQFSWQ